jgi:putative oxidoreductase
MNIVLWIIQILLGLLFAFSGSMKFIMSAEQMNEGAPVAWPAWFLHFIGICEILGAIGLIVPWLTGIKRGLTPLAASLLIIIMIGATVVSAMMSIPIAIVPFVVLLLLIVVAWGRSRVSQLR